MRGGGGGSGGGRGRKRREKRSPAGPRGNYKIAKINHKTRPAYRRYHKASRTAGQSAHIFGVYDQSRAEKRRTLRRAFPSRGRGRILPRKENCTAILQRHSKCRCKTSLPARPALLPVPRRSPRLASPPLPGQILSPSASMNPSERRGNSQ